MILLACSQAVVAILIGIVLVQRGRRGWGWTLIVLGAAVAVAGVIGLASFSP